MSSKGKNIKIKEKPVNKVEDLSLDVEVNNSSNKNSEENSLLKKLKDSISKSIPGLTVEKILENFLNLDPSTKAIIDNFEKSLNDINIKKDTKEALKKSKEATLAAIKETYIEKITENLDIIQREYSTIMEDTPKLTSGVAEFILNESLPSVIATPPAVPNPVTMLAKLKAEKYRLESECARLKKSGVDLFTAAGKLHIPSAWLIPAQVAVTTIDGLEMAIDTIPV